MDRTAFYAALRRRACPVFGTSLSQKQVDGTETLLDEAQRHDVPLRHLAYILATAYHETAHTMQPIAEYGKGKGRKYGVPAGPYGHVYYGRGYVQLTWIENYAKAGKALGFNLVRLPDLAMQSDIAAAILFAGMEEGWFTSKKLSDYIDGGRADYVNARRIVNGTDRAAMIAGYASAFERALIEAAYSPQATAPAPARPAPSLPLPGKPEPAPVPGRLEGGAIAALLALMAGISAWMAGLPCNLIGVLCQ